MLDQVSGVRVVEIDPGNITFDDFTLTRPQRSALITAGADAAQSALRTFGDRLDAPERTELRIASTENAAERDAERAIRDMQRQLGQPDRHVFISYSHRDRDWLERFETHLEPYVRNGRVTIWSDEGIRVGDAWKPAIDEALASTSIALLLVTEHYLASDFVAREELPYFEEAARQGKVRIMWVPIRSAAWDQTSLARIQAAHDTSQPLEAMNDAARSDAMTAICRQVADAFGHQTP